MNKYTALGIIEDFINSKYFPNNLVNTLNYSTDEDEYENVVMCYMNTNDEVFNELNKISIPVDYIPSEDTVHGQFIIAFKEFIQSSEYNDFDTSKFDVSTISDSDNEIVLEIKDEDIDFKNDIRFDDDKKNDDKKNEGNVEINTISSLQKPEESAFTNVIDNIGDCTCCGELQVPIDSHCCTKTISSEVVDVAEMVTSLNDFKALLERNVNESLIASVDDLIEGETYKIDSGLGGTFSVKYIGKNTDPDGIHFNKYAFYHPKTSHGFGDKTYYYTETEILNKINQ